MIKKTHRQKIILAYQKEGSHVESSIASLHFPDSKNEIEKSNHEHILQEIDERKVLKF